MERFIMLLSMGWYTKWIKVERLQYINGGIFLVNQLSDGVEFSHKRHLYESVEIMEDFEETNLNCNCQSY